MSINKASQVKFVLGIIAMTSFAALTSGSGKAMALGSSSAFQNILNQANLSQKGKYLEQSPASSSLEETNRLTKLKAFTHENGDIFDCNNGCTTGNNSVCF